MEHVQVSRQMDATEAMLEMHIEVHHAFGIKSTQGVSSVCADGQVVLYFVDVNTQVQALGEAPAH